MRCDVCDRHAEWEHTVFVDTDPHRVRLCATCVPKVDAEGHMGKIHAAPDHEAKNAAVRAFLEVVKSQPKY